MGHVKKRQCDKFSHFSRPSDSLNSNAASTAYSYSTVTSTDSTHRLFSHGTGHDARCWGDQRTKTTNGWRPSKGSTHHPLHVFVVFLFGEFLPTLDLSVSYTKSHVISGGHWQTLKLHHAPAGSLDSTPQALRTEVWLYPFEASRFHSFY